MNPETIKTIGKALTDYEALLIQKDEQIKELVESLEQSGRVIRRLIASDSVRHLDEILSFHDSLIQKHRP